MNSTALITNIQMKSSYKILPVTIFLGVLGAMGVVGNIMVLAFFTRCKRSSSTVLILCLAASDLMVSFMIIPKVIELSVIARNTNKTVCQTTHFLAAWSIYCSCFFLWMIAVDRHRKICQAFRRQLTLRSTQLVAVLMVLIGLCLSLKYFFFTDIVTVQIPNPQGHPNSSLLRGSYCSNTARYKNISIAFDVLDFVTLLAIWFTIIISYTRIILKLVEITRKRKSNSIKGSNIKKKISIPSYSNANETTSVSFIRNKQYREGSHQALKTRATNRLRACSSTLRRSYSDQDIKDTDTCNSPVTLVHAGSLDGYKTRRANKEICLGQHSSHIFTNKGPSQLERNPRSRSEESLTSFSRSFSADTNQYLTLRPRQRRRRFAVAAASAKENQMTLILGIVSVIFIACFSPFLLVKILLRQVYDAGTEAELDAGVQFAFALVYVNSVLNPVVYLIFNYDFRQFAACKGFQKHSIVTFYPHYVR